MQAKQRRVRRLVKLFGMDRCTTAAELLPLLQGEFPRATKGELFEMVGWALKPAAEAAAAAANDEREAQKRSLEVDHRKSFEGLVTALDVDGDGQLSLDEVLLLALEEEHEALRLAFATRTGDASGTIPLREFSDLLADAGLSAQFLRRLEDYRGHDKLLIWQGGGRALFRLVPEGPPALLVRTDTLTPRMPMGPAPSRPSRPSLASRVRLAD